MMLIYKIYKINTWLLILYYYVNIDLSKITIVLNKWYNCPNQ